MKSLNFARLIIVLTTILIIGFLTSFIFSFILSYSKEAIIATTATKSTTKAYNQTQQAIGQSCQYNNQCPDKAYCSKTCQCPKNYYYNETNGSCLLRKTNGLACNKNYECNIKVGLSCISSTCQCNTIFQYWNSTYYSGLGIQSGKCQNKKSYGMACASSSEGQQNTYCSRTNGAVVSRTICGDGWNYYHDFKHGICTYPALRPLDECIHPNQANYNDYTLCLKSPSEGIRRVSPGFRVDYYSGWYVRRDFGVSCSLYGYSCNVYKNLVCSNLACACYDKYYYYNSSMCVYGKRYGEICTASAQCTPNSASMICDAPYSGSSYRVCRCNATQFFDSGMEKCASLKGFNESCRESSECSGVSSFTMYCGVYPGGSLKRCLCSVGYYGVNSTCVAKVAYNLACNNTYECYENLYQSCISNLCACAPGMYFDSSDNICQYKLYEDDSCTMSSQCWSGTCSALECT